MYKQNSPNKQLRLPAQNYGPARVATYEESQPPLYQQILDLPYQLFEIVSEGLESLAESLDSFIFHGSKGKPTGSRKSNHGKWYVKSGHGGTGQVKKKRKKGKPAKN